jgi:hypothetical protein
MRNGQNKRMRGRNRNKGQNPLTRVYESNGPDVKIRGTANHVAEKYLQLARDAQSSGDPVAAENYYQHAEHYFRLIASVQEQFRQNAPFNRDQDGREGGYDDMDDDGGDQPGEPYAPREQHSQPYQQQRDHQGYPPRESQPYPPREREQRFGGRDQQGGREQHGGREQGSREQGGREQGGQQFTPRQPIQAPEGDGEDIDRLPGFITAGAGQGASAPPAQFANNANGHENAASDRFPLHRRRRRRHTGPRGDAAGGDSGGEGGERPPGE